MSEYLIHYGVKGMQWGVRRYQNEDGSYNSAGRERYWGSKKNINRTTKMSTGNKVLIGAAGVAGIAGGGYLAKKTGAASKVANSINKYAVKKDLYGKAATARFRTQNAVRTGRRVVKAPTRIVRSKMSRLPGYNTMRRGYRMVSTPTRMLSKSISRLPGGKILIGTYAVASTIDTAYTIRDLHRTKKKRKLTSKDYMKLLDPRISFNHSDATQWFVARNDDFYHSGIKGMHWGVRRYQNEDGSLTAEGKFRYGIGALGRTAGLLAGGAAIGITGAVAAKGIVSGRGARRALGTAANKAYKTIKRRTDTIRLSSFKKMGRKIANGGRRVATFSGRIGSMSYKGIRKTAATRAGRNILLYMGVISGAAYIAKNVKTYDDRYSRNHYRRRRFGR